MEHRVLQKRREKLMNRIIWLALGALLLAFGFSAQAQQTGKVYRIGYFAGGAAGTSSPRAEALRQGLQDLGYFEGKNISFVYQTAKGKLGRLP